MLRAILAAIALATPAAALDLPTHSVTELSGGVVMRHIHPDDTVCFDGEGLIEVAQGLTVIMSSMGPHNVTGVPVRWAILGNHERTRGLVLGEFLDGSRDGVCVLAIIERSEGA